MEIFQKRLRECRKKMKKTQEDVASETGIQYRTVVMNAANRTPR